MKKILSASELSRELFVRNKESEYTALNKEILKIAKAPQLGVFWIDEKNNTFELYGKSCSLRDGEVLGNVRVNPENHSQIWGEIQKQNKTWVGKQYMSIPRGRISYITTEDIDKPYFLIYLPDIYKDNESLKNTVCNEYGIPKTCAVFDFEDIHYKIRQ